MTIVPVLVAASLTLSALGVALFFWAVKGGQMDEADEGAFLPLIDRPPGGTTTRLSRSDFFTSPRIRDGAMGATGATMDLRLH